MDPVRQSASFLLADTALLEILPDIVKRPFPLPCSKTGRAADHLLRHRFAHGSDCPKSHMKGFPLAGIHPGGCAIPELLVSVLQLRRCSFRGFLALANRQ